MAQYSNSTRHPTQCTMALEESKTQVYQIDASHTQRGLLVHLISTKHLVAHPCTTDNVFAGRAGSNAVDNNAIAGFNEIMLG